MVKQGIVLGHVISQWGIEVEKAKVDLISNLPPPRTVKEIRSFLGHAGFYRQFIKDFSKIARPLCRLLAKETSFEFDEERLKAFGVLNEILTSTPIKFGEAFFYAIPELTHPLGLLIWSHCGQCDVLSLGVEWMCVCKYVHYVNMCVNILVCVLCCVCKYL
jgi:hypothetical protein